ncbi:SH3 domain-containing protein [Clostridium algidicarnis]|uniref:SH3 domain-containing protein n=1 Tax=Clostridium algidicarnis TaxID=37659 RepID=UPI001C0AD33E|nr:SH3 domain-containing protein [Clostridium algidicarnis]MBU3205562.1 SH3 domain-containing protein [Clostridium algidicarnis]
MKIIDVGLRFNGLRQNNNSPKSIVVHHIEANNWTVERLNSLHKDEFGWAGIGYHFYIRKDGAIYRGRPETSQGAHVAEYNTNSLGVAFEGDYHKVDKEMPQAQFNAWVELKSYLFNKYGIINIYGHKEVGSSNCPGQYFPLDKIKDGVIETIEESSIDNILYGITTANVLNVRDGASTSNSILGTLPKGTKVKISPQYSKGDWYSIYYGNNGGFIHKDYVNINGQEGGLQEPIIEENPIIYGTVKVNSVLNVRDGASTNSSIIGRLSNGEKVKIDKRYSQGDFYSIYYGNSGGFIHKDYVILD